MAHAQRLQGAYASSVPRRQFLGAVWNYQLITDAFSTRLRQFLGALHATANR